MALADTPSNPPPSYEDSAAQHGQSTPASRPPLPQGKLRAPLPLDIPILSQLRNKRIILASASPRRKQLLAQIGLTNLEILPSTDPENVSKSLGPLEYVLQTAHRKCLSVYQHALSQTELASIPLPDPAVVISADTIVVSHSGAILEKPRSEADHIRTLKMLRDQHSHKVYTAVCVLAPRDDARSPGYNIETWVEETKVMFSADTSDEFLLAYVKTREGVDKAGGYGIQGMGSLLVEGIEGSWDNVVGLPLRITLGLIEKAVLKQGDDDEDDDDDVEE